MVAIRTLNSYFGVLIFLLGLIGNIWNVLIFRHYSFRSSSISIYMLIGSLSNLIYLLINLLNLIVEHGFNGTWRDDSLIWCKSHDYLSQCSSLISLSSLILSAIDRFFSTCHQIKWRSLNSPSFAQYISCIVIFLWLSLTIPTIIYSRPNAFSSIIWSNVHFYFLEFCCHCIFPWLLSSIFSYLALRNVRINRQCRIAPSESLVLTRMAQIDNEFIFIVFSQTILCLLSTIPYCAETIFHILHQTNKTDSHKQSILSELIRLISYLNFSLTFYTNFYSSKIFRQLARKVLRNLFKSKQIISTQITIINHHQETHQTQLTIRPSRTVNITHVAIIS